MKFLIWIEEFNIFYQWAGSGVYYLFGLCSRLVTSVQFLKTDTANLLDEYAPKIVEGFKHFFKIWFFAGKIAAIILAVMQCFHFQSLNFYCCNLKLLVF